MCVLQVLEENSLEALMQKMRQLTESSQEEEPTQEELLKRFQLVENQSLESKSQCVCVHACVCVHVCVCAHTCLCVGVCKSVIMSRFFFIPSVSFWEEKNTLFQVKSLFVFPLLLKSAVLR